MDWRFIFIVSFFFILYAAINVYLFVKIRSYITKHFSRITGRIAETLFWILVLIFPLSRILNFLLGERISGFFTFGGALYFGYMVYLFFFFIAVDFILVTIHLYRRYRRKERIVLMPHIKKPIGITVAILTLVLVIYGHRQSLDPEIKKVRIKLERKSGVRDSVHLVFLSDLHLGNLIGKDRLEKWVHKINGLNPDIVIIGGDIINRDLEPVINAQIAEVFKKVKSRYGLYAVTGNHDYFQNVNNLVKYLEKGNIRFLQDRGVLIEDSFYLIGRKDRSSVNFGHSREALKTVLRPLEGNFPKILIDHQPIGLKEASDNGIDLQISGHTHDGQMFPVTLFIGLLYEKAYGHHQRGKTQYLVSSGVGTAGPPLRVGSSGEIVSIKIDFK